MAATPRPGLQCAAAALIGLGGVVMFAQGPAALPPGASVPRGAGANPATPWAFSFRLPDADYAQRSPPPQADPLPDRIHWLLHPTTGAPALAWSGATLNLHLAEALTPPARGVTVTLETRIGGERLSYPLTIVQVAPATKDGRHSRVTCVVPATVPRESFDLEVRLPDGRRERHVRAVRVLHRTRGPLSLALVADHQLWDPSSRLLRGARHPGLHPPRGGRSAGEEIARQGIAELDLLDPDLVLHLGDVTFGLDPSREWNEALAVLASAGPATFYVPGNHDGYARYGLDLKASLPRLAVGMLECRRHLQADDGPRWRAVWAFLECVYGDLRPALFRRLLSDGLVAWRRTLGPSEYAFDLGPFRFLGINTYDGSAERRHAYSIHADIQGLRLGAPLVDNYGGTLSVAQLRWIEAEAKDAEASGRRLVVLGHHDPRGNPEGEPYHANQPFPTDPVGPGHFEAWNFDGPWDSDPTDGRGPESATRHSGHALLRLLGRHGGTYVSGHVHRDRTTRYAPGDALGDAILAERPSTFLQVTTASAAPGEGGYWGYRLLSLRTDGQVDSTPFAEGLGLSSLPVGNLWLGPGQGAQEIAALHTALPRSVQVRIRALLPHRAEGYRFAATPASAQVALLDVAPVTGGRALYYLAVRLPAAGSALARNAEDVLRFVLSAQPLSGNRPPVPRLLVNGRPWTPGTPVSVRPGSQVALDAQGSTDPEGHGLLPPLYESPQGRGGRGDQVTLTAPHRGNLSVRLLLRDTQGAAADARILITASASGPPRSPLPRVAPKGCEDASRAVLWGAVVILLLGGALLWLGRRSRKA